MKSFIDIEIQEGSCLLLSRFCHFFCLKYISHSLFDAIKMKSFIDDQRWDSFEGVVYKTTPGVSTSFMKSHITYNTQGRYKDYKLLFRDAIGSFCVFLPLHVCVV